MNNHSSFGVRRLVAAMARASARKRRQVAALHIGLVICRLLRASRASLTPTSNYTRELQQPLPGCASLLLLYPGFASLTPANFLSPRWGGILRAGWIMEIVGSCPRDNLLVGVSLC